MNKSQVKRKSIGFTLIELLVVIAVIALLLSVITPALRKAKEAAQSMVCRSNIRQMSVALQSYYTDNNNKALQDGGGINFWFLDIAPYLGESNTGIAATDGSRPEDLLKATMELLKCPSTKAPEDPWDPAKSEWENSRWGTARNQYRYHIVRAEGAYGMNLWVGGWTGEDANGNPTPVEAYDFSSKSAAGKANLKRSYREMGCTKPTVPVIADAVWVDFVPHGTDTVPADLSKGDPINGFGLERVCTTRHGKDTHIAFADGHVEKIPLEQLWMLSWHKKFEKKADVQIDYNAN